MIGTVATIGEFMRSRDLQNWMHIGTLSRSWFLALPNQLTTAVDSLSANSLGRAGVMWRSGSWKAPCSFETCSPAMNHNCVNHWKSTTEVLGSWEVCANRLAV